jgi:hypothetical protein
MEETKRLEEEIKEITIQYRAEVGRGRKPWPKAVTTRIEKLAELGWKAPRIAAETGVPYFSILHWRSREKKKFHSMSVGSTAKHYKQLRRIVSQAAAATVAVSPMQHVGILVDGNATFSDPESMPFRYYVDRGVVVNCHTVPNRVSCICRQRS